MFESDKYTQTIFFISEIGRYKIVDLEITEADYVLVNVIVAKSFNEFLFVQVRYLTVHPLDSVYH